MQLRLINPVLVKYELKDTPIQKLSILAHIFLIGSCGIFVIDRSELDVTALQILQVLNQIMSEPLIPLGKTSVTLWTIVYIVVLSVILLVVTGKIQHWMIDHVFTNIKVDIGEKIGRASCRERV